MSENLLDVMETQLIDSLKYYDNILDRYDDEYLDNGRLLVSQLEYDDNLDKRNDIAEDLGIDSRFAISDLLFDNQNKLELIDHQYSFKKIDKINYNSRTIKQLEKNENIKQFIKENNTNHVCVQPKLAGIDISIQANEYDKAQVIVKGNGEQGLNISHHFQSNSRFSKLSKNIKHGDIIRGTLYVSLKYVSKNKIVDNKEYITTILKNPNAQNLKTLGIKFVAYGYKPYTNRKLSINEQLFELHDTFGLPIIEQNVVCIFRDLDLYISVSNLIENTIKSDIERQYDSKISSILYLAMNTYDDLNSNRKIGALSIQFKPELYLTKFKYIIKKKDEESENIKSLVYFDDIVIRGKNINHIEFDNIKDLDSLYPLDLWYENMFIRVGENSDGELDIYEANINYNKITIENRWKEWRKAHLQSVSINDANGDITTLKNLMSVKNRIKKLLLDKCGFSDVPTSFTTNIALNCHRNYEFYNNINDYLIYSIKIVMETNLVESNLGAPLKKLIRKNRKAISSTTFEDIIKNTFTTILEPLDENNLDYTLDNVKKVVKRDERLNSSLSYILPVYEVLNQYCKQF